MAQNIIAFPADRVKSAISINGIERPVWDAEAIALSKSRYEMRRGSGVHPSWVMEFWRQNNLKWEAEWAAYEEAIRAANGDNIVELRRV